MPDIPLKSYQENRFERGIYDKRNLLNDLTGKEWLFSTKTVIPKKYPNELSSCLLPVQLRSEIIETFSKPKWRILDPFYGSELTLLAGDSINSLIESGLVRETEGLLKKGYSPHLKPMKSLGYRHMIQYLEGTWELDEAIRKLQADTRRYAKRQLTWFRADPEVNWMNPAGMDNIIKKVSEFL